MYEVKRPFIEAADSFKSYRLATRKAWPKFVAMGHAELDSSAKLVVITSHIILYGSAADDVLAERVRSEIEAMWNEPQGRVLLADEAFAVRFRITAETQPVMDELTVLQNTDPRNNYFRVEPFVQGSISFVDGLGCNSGYFLLGNLYEGSTTAAHEYGHTLGLDHPAVMDIRGGGVPGIMYPRGTLVDPEYQYDPTVMPGLKGGTMHPQFRKVKQGDIQNLKLYRLRFEGRRAVVGEFTNVYHWNHEPGETDPFGPGPVLA